jgi:thiamine-phosphate pyrophosphorylase
MNFPANGLYAITQTDSKPADRIVTEVTAAIKGGAVVIQYREKRPAITDQLAQQLLNVCRKNNIPLIINDNIDLALRIGADGVHLGKDDYSLKLARHQLGDNAIIGTSCYNDLELAVAAANAGADYVAFGRFFPSNSKPLAAPAQVETLREARQKLQIPIVAIGGILPENGDLLLEAGADLLAVIGGIFDQNPEQSAKEFQHLF